MDESRQVAKAYGVWQKFGLTAWNLARPALFLVDRNGTIRYSFIAGRQDQYPSHSDIMQAMAALTADS